MTVRSKPKTFFGRAASVTTLLCCLIFATAAQADDYRQMEQRVKIIESKLSRIEERSGIPANEGSAASTGMLGLVEDLQRVREEVRQLRGDVERLQYEAQQNQQRQRDMFIDIEKRLTALEQGRTGSNGTVPAPAPNTAQPGMSSTTAPAVAQPPEDIPDAGLASTASAGASGSASAAGEASITTPTLPAATAASEQDEYLKAFEVLKQARYDDSITAFQQFLGKYPNGAYSDNALYWLAETYYVKKDYQASLANFQKLLIEHPDSSKLPGALLKVGYIQYELGNNADARLALERVRNEFSGSSVADLAVQRLERMDREGR